MNPNILPKILWHVNHRVKMLTGFKAFKYIKRFANGKRINDLKIY